MSTPISFQFFSILAAVCSLPLSAFAQTQGSSVKGGDVTGSSVTGSSVTGGSVTGGNVTGGSVTGGDVTGGSVTGGSVTGGSATAGTVTQGTVSPGTATAHVGGRTITATVEGSVSVQGDNSKATVTLGSHSLVVERERLLVDGKERAKIPADAKTIRIQFSKNVLHVRADDREVLVTDLK